METCKSCAYFKACHKTVPTDSTDVLNILNQPVRCIFDSVRVLNCLNSLKIETVGQLVNTTDQELFSVRNFGEHSHSIIKETLERYGLRNRMGSPLAIESGLCCYLPKRESVCSDDPACSKYLKQWELIEAEEETKGE